MSFRCTKPTPEPVKTLAYGTVASGCRSLPGISKDLVCGWSDLGGCYLIDTGDGLILIDTAIPESLYLMVDSIYRAGFCPKDIKKILLSHAHFDHMGGAAAMKALPARRSICQERMPEILPFLSGRNHGAGCRLPPPELSGGRVLFG